MRILVIDDDASLRKILRLALSRAGYDVVEASQGAEGVARYREEPAALVVTDILMPQQEGLETIRELRHLDPQVKILAMSGGGAQLDLDVLEIARRFGATAILEKPFDIADFLALVKQTLLE